MRITSTLILTAAVLAIAPQVRATTIGTNNVTDTLGPNFFFDTAATGGGDSALLSAPSFIRDFGVLGAGLTTVSISGAGWAVGGNMTNNPSTLFASLTITFLGADNAGGGGDDVLFGTRSDVYQYNGAGEYSWSFTTPLSLDITPNATVNNFELAFQGFTDNTQTAAANLRFKTTTGTALSAVKLSVAGTAVPVPEPTTAALAGIGMIGLFLFRRRK